MNKLYSVHDHWTDINKKNDVDIESIDGVITGIKVNGEDYGGTSWTEVFSGDVVTSGEAAPFSGTINAVLSGSDTIKVFYNDGIYILPKQVTDDGIFYGATPGANPGEIDFSEIPFLIRLGEVNTALYTQSPGPQDITILEPQSGGGESDFSTAEVTVINNSSSELYTPKLVWHDDEQLFAGFDLDPHSETTFKVVLYKGQQALDNLFKGSQVIVDGTGIAVTGDIENRSDESEVYIVITGNGTITIS